MITKEYGRMCFRVTCKETQRMIISFIQGDLEDSEQGSFIDHVNHCRECREEYDVYYTLLTSVKILEEDGTGKKSYVVDSERNLRNIEDDLIKKKMRLIRRRAIFVALVLCFALVLRSG